MNEMQAESRAPSTTEEKEAPPTAEDRHRPDVRELEHGDLRAELRGPAWLLELAELEIELTEQEDPAIVFAVVDALGSGFELTYSGSTAWLFWGKSRSLVSCDVRLTTTAEIGRRLDPKEQGTRERVAEFVRALEAEQVACWRECSKSATYAIVPDLGEPRQVGLFEGMGAEGRFEVFIRNPDEGAVLIAGQSCEYESLRELVEDGWRVD